MDGSRSRSLFWKCGGQLEELLQTSTWTVYLRVGEPALMLRLTTVARCAAIVRDLACENHSKNLWKSSPVWAEMSHMWQFDEGAVCFVKAAEQVVDVSVGTGSLAKRTVDFKGRLTYCMGSFPIVEENQLEMTSIRFQSGVTQAHRSYILLAKKILEWPNFYQSRPKIVFYLQASHFSQRK
ncbi:hypothetical protein RB195_003522 [Necator americanus]|uniref:Uncharacterized protein n=1 Tax=Necator americanus TaxID=51031 RepID=A0ABR1DPQ1_NECAM